MQSNHQERRISSRERKSMHSGDDKSLKVRNFAKHFMAFTR